MNHQAWNNVAVSLLTFLTLMNEAIRSSESQILRRVTWRRISENGIFQETLQIYMLVHLKMLSFWWSVQYRRLEAGKNTSTVSLQ
jgi:hypothetical protein